MDWNDLKLVLAIGKAGSLSGAARQLGVTHSTVFRRLNDIEKEVDVRLFDRQKTGYILTEAGEVAVESAVRIESEVNGLTRQLVGRDQRLKGPLRVTSPELIGARVIAPELHTFCAAHPDIAMQLEVTSTALQLSRRDADLAVRVTRNPPDNYIGRRICKFRFCMYATRSYLDLHGQDPLSQQQWLLTDDGFDQLPAGVWKGENGASARIAFGSNSASAVIDAAKDSLGIAPLPCFAGDAEEDLVRYMDPLQNLTMDLWVLIHPDLKRTARVTKLMSALTDVLERKSEKFEGVLPRKAK